MILSAKILLSIFEEYSADELDEDPLFAIAWADAFDWDPEAELETELEAEDEALLTLGANIKTNANTRDSASKIFVRFFMRVTVASQALLSRNNNKQGNKI